MSKRGIRSGQSQSGLGEGQIPAGFHVGKSGNKTERTDFFACEKSGGFWAPRIEGGP